MPVFHIPSAASSLNDLTPDYAHDPVPNQKSDIRRWHTLLELLTTELGYLDDLRILVSIYLHRLPSITDAHLLRPHSTSSTIPFINPSPSPSRSPSPNSHSPALPPAPASAPPHQHSYSFSDLTALSLRHKSTHSSSHSHLPSPCNNTHHRSDSNSSSGSHSHSHSHSNPPSSSSTHPHSHSHHSKPNLPLPSTHHHNHHHHQKHGHTSKQLLSEPDIRTIARNTDEVLGVHESLVRDILLALRRFGVGVDVGVRESECKRRYGMDLDVELDSKPFPRARTQCAWTENPSTPIPIPTSDELASALHDMQDLLIPRIDELVQVVCRVFADHAGNARFDIYEPFCARHPESLDLVRTLGAKFPAEWAVYERRCAMAVVSEEQRVGDVWYATAKKEDEVNSSASSSSPVSPTSSSSTPPPSRSLTGPSTAATTPSEHGPSSSSDDKDPNHHARTSSSPPTSYFFVLNAPSTPSASPTRERQAHDPNSTPTEQNRVRRHSTPSLSPVHGATPTLDPSSASPKISATTTTTTTAPAIPTLRHPNVHDKLLQQQKNAYRRSTGTEWKVEDLNLKHALKQPQPQQQGKLPITHRAPPRLAFVDYLIKPVQRICKYPLLLEQLRIKRAGGEHSDVDDVERAINEMRRVASQVDEARRRQDILTKSALIAARINASYPTHTPSHSHISIPFPSSSTCTPTPTSTPTTPSHSPTPTPPPTHITPCFLASLGACLLAGSLDVVHYNVLRSPLHGTGTGTTKVKYLGAFLYMGGYIVLVKVCKGKVYEPRHWFPSAAFEIVDVGEDDALLPCSFRLSYMDHHFDFAAACKREKEVWISALHESRRVSPTWTNEPASSLHLNHHAEQIVQEPTSSLVKDDTTEEQTCIPLSTIHSISDLDSNDAPHVSHSVFPRSASTTRIQSRLSSFKDLTLLAPRQQDPYSTFRPPPSRRSSSTSVKSIFSAMSSDSSTMLLRRASLQHRRNVERGLADVFSEPCLAARFHAQTHEEVLFPQPPAGSNHGLGVAGSMGIAAKNRLTKRDSILVPRRRNNSSEAASVAAAAEVDLMDSRSSLVPSLQWTTTKDGEPADMVDSPVIAAADRTLRGDGSSSSTALFRRRSLFSAPEASPRRFSSSMSSPTHLIEPIVEPASRRLFKNMILFLHLSSLTPMTNRS